MRVDAFMFLSLRGLQKEFLCQKVNKDSTSNGGDNDIVKIVERVLSNLNKKFDHRVEVCCSSLGGLLVIIICDIYLA